MIRRKKEVNYDIVVKLLVNSALVAKLLTDYPDAESRLDRALAMAEAVGQSEMKNRVLAEKAGLYYRWGRLDEGLTLAERVISAGGAKYDENQASALNTAGNIHLRRCGFDAAERCFRQALEHYRKLKMETSIGTVINNLANIYNIRGDARQAQQLYLQALERFEEQDDIFRAAHVMHSLSQVLLSAKDTAQAKHYLLKSLNLRRRVQDYRGMVNSLLFQIGIFTDEQDFDGAIEKLRQADDIIRERRLNEPYLKAYREGEAGALYFFAGDFGRAEGCFLRLINMSQQMKQAAFLAGGYSWLGKTRVFRDGTEAGIADARKGVELAESGNLPYEFKSNLLVMVECYCRLGKTELAEKAAENYVREALKQGDTQEMVDAELAKYLSGNKNTINK